MMLMKCNAPYEFVHYAGGRVSDRGLWELKPGWLLNWGFFNSLLYANQDMSYDETLGQ